MRDDRKLLGFYDTVVDTMGEWWIWLDGRKLLGEMVISWGADRRVVDFSVSV